MSNVKKLRLAKGWTQQQLADKVGVSRITIINIENHMYSTVNSDVTKNLCKIFETTPFRLFGTDNFRVRPQTKEDVEWLIEELSKELEQWEQEKNF